MQENHAQRINRRRRRVGLRFKEWRDAGQVRNGLSGGPKQNPVATLVQTVIANQFQRFINGCALAPPIFTAPKGDNAITAQAATAKIEQSVNNQPNLTTIKFLMPVTTVLNASPSISFKLTMKISATNAGQKTQWLSAWCHGVFDS